MKLFNVNTLSLISIPILFYFFFAFTFYALLALLAGLAITYFLLEGKRQVLLMVTLAVSVIFLFRTDIYFTASFLVGANLASYYLYLKSSNENETWIGINLLNSILLTNIVFQSSVEKFRGFNKLNASDINYTIMLLVLIGLATYFLTKAIYANSAVIKKEYQKRLISIITLLIIGTYYSISVFFFKEIGTATIFIPLLCGIVLGIINLFVKKKSIVININELILMAIIPYQISGLLGVTLAFTSSLIYTNILGESFKIEPREINSTINKFAPIIFLLAATEIRENKGLITRFNLTTGYQIGWILISVLLFEYGQQYAKKLYKTLAENEIQNLFPILATLFTIMLIAIIMRFGGNESLSALLLGSSFYLFLLGLLESKKQTEKLQFVLSIGSTAGAMAFWILTKV